MKLKQHANDTQVGYLKLKVEEQQKEIEQLRIDKFNLMKEVDVLKQQIENKADEDAEDERWNRMVNGL